MGPVIVDMNNPSARILRFIGWFFLANSLLLWVVGFHYLQLMLQCTTLFHNLMADYSGFIGQSVIILFIIINYLCYMTMLAYIPASFILIVALIIHNRYFSSIFRFSLTTLRRKVGSTSYCFKSELVGPSPNLNYIDRLHGYFTNGFIWFLSIFLALVCSILVILDSYVYAMFRFHLNMVLFNFIFSKDARAIFDLSSLELLTISCVVIFILLIECGLAMLVWKKIILGERFKIGRSLFVSWFGCVLFCYFTVMLSISVHHNNLFIQQASILPLYNKFLGLVVPEKNADEHLDRFSEEHYMQTLFSRDKINYPRHPMHCMDTIYTQKPYNIIFIMVDSLRFDSLQYMPNVTNFADKSWQFMNHISGGNSTQAGLFSLFYSIPSTYWTAALEQEISPIFIELLLKYSYKTRVIWSSEMHNPPMNKTIYHGLPNIAVDGAPGENIAQWDRDTTRDAIDFLSQKSSQPFFLNLFYNAPHAFCSSKYVKNVYQPSMPECSRISLNSNTDPKAYYNSYLNTVSFIDDEINKVLKKIEKAGYLDNSIVIITSDHGQEFNDNKQNYWGHASNYTPFQVHVPLLIHWPNQLPRKITYTTSGYDVIPTLLSRVFQCNNPISDYSVGRDLLQETKRDSFILVGSYVNNGIVEPDRITTIHSSGETKVTDTHLQPLRDDNPRKDIINQALKLMRLFYKQEK